MAVTAVVGEAISLHQLHQLHQLGGDRERGGQSVRTRRTGCPDVSGLRADNVSGLSGQIVRAV